MAALNAVTATNSGTLDPPAAVSASDTVAQSVLGPNGALLSVNNGGGSSDTITISDAGATPAGNPLASGAITGLTVANGTSKVFRLYPNQVNPATGLITITHSFTTTVTYQLYAI
jgi:hypothetical protein